MALLGPWIQGRKGPKARMGAGGVSTAAAPGAEAATGGLGQLMWDRDISSARSVLCCERPSLGRELGKGPSDTVLHPGER